MPPAKATTTRNLSSRIRRAFPCQHEQHTTAAAHVISNHVTVTFFNTS